MHVDSECELTDNFFKSAGKESEEVKIKDAKNLSNARDSGRNSTDNAKGKM